MHYRKFKTSAFILLPQSKNNCIDCKPCLAVWRSGWELRTQLGPSISIVLTVYFLSPPPTSLLIQPPGPNGAGSLLLTASLLFELAPCDFFSVSKYLVMVCTKFHHPQTKGFCSGHNMSGTIFSSYSDYFKKLVESTGCPRGFWRSLRGWEMPPNTMYNDNLHE